MAVLESPGWGCSSFLVLAVLGRSALRSVLTPWSRSLPTGTRSAVKPVSIEDAARRRPEPGPQSPAGGCEAPPGAKGAGLAGGVRQLPRPSEPLVRLTWPEASRFLAWQRRRRAPHRPRRGEACAPAGAVHSGTGNVTHSIGSGSICRRLMSPSDQNPAPISIRHQSPPVRFHPCATLRPDPAGSIGRPACESALDLVPVPCHACPMNGPVLRSSTHSTAPARQAACPSEMWTNPSKPCVRRRADTSRALVFGLRLSRRVLHFNSPCGLPAVLSGRVPAVPPARTRRGAGVGDGGRDVARNGRVARPEPRPERR